LKKKLKKIIDNFCNKIKQTAEPFEVPFNEGHWTDMDATLNKIDSKNKKCTFNFRWSNHH